VSATITLADLADQPLWVAWQAEPGSAPEKGKKVPYREPGRRARPNDPTTWLKRERARACAERLPKPLGQGGVGINLADIGQNRALAGIDIDTCIDPETRALASWASDIVTKFDSYTEVSPSGAGLKVFFMLRLADRDALRAELGKGGQKWVVEATGDNHPPAIELYLGARYFTVTERLVDDRAIAVRLVDADIVRWLVRTGRAIKGETPHSEPASNDGSRSAKAFRLGQQQHRAGADFASMCSALRDDPETSEWYREKGETNGGRELQRIWDKVSAVASGEILIDPHAPYETAKLFRYRLYEREGASTLHHRRGEFFAWTGTHYPVKEDDEVRAELYRFLAGCTMRNKHEVVPVRPNAAMVNNAEDALRATALLPLAVAPPTWLEPGRDVDAADIIACANGLLHLPTLTLLSHTPKFFTQNALPFGFEQGAPEPSVWLAFLSQLWPEDPDSVAALQELFGYLLTADTSLQKIFLLVGPKRSGKGTIARVLTKLLGPDNVVAPTLAALGSNFGLQPLIGKRAAIVSDARLGGRADAAAIAERLLSISGEDAITIDRKYKDGWTGQLATRFLILSNELPRLNDASGALASRFIVLVLTESFYGREDPGLTRKLITELPGILNWSIAGWRRLRDRGHFLQPQSAAEVVEELCDLGSPIGTFVKERCVIGAGRNVDLDVLFLEWQIWSASQGREWSGDKQRFGRDLRAAVPGIRLKKVRVREDDLLSQGRKGVYEGIGLMQS